LDISLFLFFSLIFFSLFSFFSLFFLCARGTHTYIYIGKGYSPRCVVDSIQRLGGALAGPPASTSNRKNLSVLCCGSKNQFHASCFRFFYHLGSLQPLAMSCSVRRPDGSLTDSRCFTDKIKPQLPSHSSCVSITITGAMLQHSSKKTHRIFVTVVKNCKVFAVPFCLCSLLSWSR
jgi:hypothetical protein